MKVRNLKYSEEPSIQKRLREDVYFCDDGNDYYYCCRCHHYHNYYYRHCYRNRYHYFYYYRHYKYDCGHSFISFRFLNFIIFFLVFLFKCFAPSNPIFPSNFLLFYPLSCILSFITFISCTFILQYFLLFFFLLYFSFSLFSSFLVYLTLGAYYGNRAASWIMLKEFQRAADDCVKGLQLEKFPGELDKLRIR